MDNQKRENKKEIIRESNLEDFRLPDFCYTTIFKNPMSLTQFEKIQIEKQSASKGR